MASEPAVKAVTAAARPLIAAGLRAVVRLLDLAVDVIVDIAIWRRAAGPEQDELPGGRPEEDVEVRDVTGDRAGDAAPTTPPALPSGSKRSRASSRRRRAR